MYGSVVDNLQVKVANDKVHKINSLYLLTEVCKLCIQPEGRVFLSSCRGFCSSYSLVHRNYTTIKPFCHELVGLKKLKVLGRRSGELSVKI